MRFPPRNVQNTDDVIEHGSKEFEQFCLFLGELIKLKGWTGYTGSLDVKSACQNVPNAEVVYSKCR